MSEDQNTLSGGGIPQEFWAVPETFIPDETLQFLHADICARLRNENPDADTLELMAIERIASLYFYMRAKETTNNYASDQAYKGMMNLWVTMASDLRKARLESLTTADAQAEIMKTLVDAVNEALAGVDPEVANTVKRRIVHKFETVV